MTATLAASFILLLCVGGFGLAATINQFAIVDAVNAKLPADDQFNALGWHLPKTLRLHRAYRRLYPDGRLLKRQASLMTLMMLCLVTATVLLGFGVFLTAWLGVGSLLLLCLLYWRK